MKIKLTKELYHSCRSYSYYSDYSTILNNYKCTKNKDYFIHFNKRKIKTIEKIIDTILEYNKNPYSTHVYYVHMDKKDFQKFIFKIYYLIEDKKQEFLNQQINDFFRKNTKNK